MALNRIKQIHKKIGGKVKVHPGYNPEVERITGRKVLGKYQLLYKHWSVVEVLTGSPLHKLTLEAYDGEEIYRFKTVTECAKFLKKNYEKTT